MRLISIILALIVSALCSCNHQESAPPLEISEDCVLSFGVYDFNAINIKNTLFNGSTISITKRDWPLSFYQNERYDFTEYYQSCISLVDGEHPIRPLEVYELKGFDSTLSLAVDIQGVALQKANGSVLSILTWPMTDFESRRGTFVCGPQSYFSIPHNLLKDVDYTTVLYRYRNITRLFILPLHKPLNETPAATVANYQSILYPWQDCIVPQQDSVMMFPCFGNKPAILCQDMHDGRTQVTVKDAKAQGEDAVFYVCGSFNHQGINAFFYNRSAKWESTANTSSTALCLDNGKVLNIIQFPVDAKTLSQYRVTDPPKYEVWQEGNLTLSRSLIFIRTNKPYAILHRLAPIISGLEVK